MSSTVLPGRRSNRLRLTAPLGVRRIMNFHAPSALAVFDIE